MTLFLLAHLAFVVLGLVAVTRVPASVLALYAASQVVFVSYFAGVLPLAFAVRVDPALVAAAAIVLLKRRPTAFATR
jgi:hypothetical protein